MYRTVLDEGTFLILHKPSSFGFSKIGRKADDAQLVSAEFYAKVINSKTVSG